MTLAPAHSEQCRLGARAAPEPRPSGAFFLVCPSRRVLSFVPSLSLSAFAPPTCRSLPAAGTLAGSRVAGALVAICDHMGSADGPARLTGAAILTTSTYVDNLAFATRDGSGACRRGSRVLLSARWGLDLPASSCEVMVPGCAPLAVGGRGDAPEVVRLGCVVSADGSCRRWVDRVVDAVRRVLRHAAVERRAQG